MPNRRLAVAQLLKLIRTVAEIHAKIPRLIAYHRVERGEQNLILIDMMKICKELAVECEKLVRTQGLDKPLK